MIERWTPAYDRLFDRHYELNGGEPFCRTMAWLWICHHTQYEDGTRIVRGEPLMLKRGEILGSLRWFADQWGWSVKRVRNFLEYLHDCGKLGTVRGTGQGTVYRVVNYGRWRSEGNGKGHSKGHDRGTVGAQGIEVIEVYKPPSSTAGTGANDEPRSDSGVPPRSMFRQEFPDLGRAVEVLEEMHHPGGERATTATLRTSFLYDDPADANPDPSVKGESRSDRYSLISRALLELSDQGKSQKWATPLLSEFVRRIAKRDDRHERDEHGGTEAKVGRGQKPSRPNPISGDKSRRRGGG